MKLIFSDPNNVSVRILGYSTWIYLDLLLLTLHISDKA